MTMLKFPEKNQKKECYEKGAILVTALLITAAMLIIGIPLLFKLSSQYRITEKSYRSLAALNLAEAGVERAIWDLNGLWMISAWVENEDGILTLAIEDFQASDGSVVGDIDIRIMPNLAGVRHVEATGRVPFLSSRSVNKTVRVVLEKYYSSIFKWAVFTDTGIFMNSNGEIDSFDSREGPYDESNRGHKGHTGTNAYQNSEDKYGVGIEFSSNVNIYGGVAAGAGTGEDYLDSVIDDSASNTYIVRGKHILEDPFYMPSLYLNDPELLGSWYNDDGHIDDDYYKGSFYAGKHDTVEFTPEQSGLYNSFIVDVGAKVTIQGDVRIYIDDPLGGEFLMKSNSEIELADESSSLMLILGNVTSLQRSNTFLNLTQDSSKLKILGMDDFTGEFHLDSNTEMYAAVYMPKATVHYDSNHDLYGSIICGYLDFNSNSHVHYDEALGEVDIIKGGVPCWRVKSWQEKHFP